MKVTKVSDGWLKLRIKLVRFVRKPFENCWIDHTSIVQKIRFWEKIRFLSSRGHKKPTHTKNSILWSSLRNKKQFWILSVFFIHPVVVIMIVNPPSLIITEYNNYSTAQKWPNAHVILLLDNKRHPLKHNCTVDPKNTKWVLTTVGNKNISFTYYWKYRTFFVWDIFWYTL